MLNFYHHPSAEALADAFADQLLAFHRADPLRKVRVLVPDAQVQRWLFEHTVTRLGIAANWHAQNPLQFATGLIAQAGAGRVHEDPHEAAVMRWRLFELIGTDAEHLGALAQAPQNLAEESLEATEERASGLLRFRMAERAARTFERYGWYRPGWLDAWAMGHESDTWQARLWQTAQMHWRQWPRHRLIQQWLSETTSEFQEPVLVFGCTHMPPRVLDILHKLALTIPVHYYLPAVSWHYLGDLPSRRQLKLADELPEHPLLSSLGGLDRDFARLLFQNDALNDQAIEISIEPSPHAALPPWLLSQSDALPDPKVDLLARIQRDLLSAERPARPSLFAEAPLADDTFLNQFAQDGSIEIRHCPDALTEVENLLTKLAERFAQDPELKPEDVLIASPKLDDYAPLLISASKKAARAGLPRLGLQAAQQSPLQSLLLFLRSVHQRLMPELLRSWLTQAHASAVVGIEPDQLKHVLQWLEEAGFKSDFAAADRARVLRIEPCDCDVIHTLSFAIERLLLGFLAKTEAFEWQGLVALEKLELSSAETLARLWRWLRRLMHWRGEFGQSHTLEYWQAQLPVALEQLFAPSDQATEALDTLHGALGKLEQQCLLARTQPQLIDAELCAHVLEPWFESAPAEHWSTGCIRVTSFGPAVSMPHRIIAVLGLDEGALPRSDRDFGPRASPATSHDALEVSLQALDRSHFLRMLQSARETLYLSYLSGTGAKPAAPSLLLSELIEFIDQHYLVSTPQVSTPGASIDRPLVAPKMISGASLEHPSSSVPLAPELNRELPATAKNIALVWPECMAVFSHPTRFFVREILAMTLSEPPEAFKQEAFLSASSREEIRIQEALAAELDHDRGDLAQTYHRLRARALLPEAAFGLKQLHQTYTLMAPLHAHKTALQARLGNPARISVPDQLKPWGGQLDQIYRDGMHLWLLPETFAGHAGRVLKMRIQACLFAAAQQEGVIHLHQLKRNEVLSQTITWAGAKARQLLDQLLAFRLRLEQQALAFAPRTGLAIAKEAPDDDRKRFERGRSHWFGGRHFRGEASDRFHALVWGQSALFQSEQDATTQAFIAHSELLFGDWARLT